jgi:hypothetical protein
LEDLAIPEPDPNATLIAVKVAELCQVIELTNTGEIFPRLKKTPCTEVLKVSRDLDEGEGDGRPYTCSWVN